MREMKDSGVEWIGAIPSRWFTVQLGSIFSEHKHKNTGMQSNNLLSLSYGNIVRKDINTLDGLLPESFEGYNVIGPGDIVLRLTDLQNDQRSLRVGICREKGIVTSAYVTLRRRNPSMNSQFFYYLIHSYDVRKGFYGMGAGVRQGLNYAGIKKITLPLPSAGEQSRIVLLLNDKHAQIDALIQNVQTQIEKLKAYKQSLITEVVTKGLDPTVPMKDSGVDYLGYIPMEWSIISIGQAFNYVGGFAFKSEIFTIDETKYQVIRIGNVKNDNLILDCKQIYVDENSAESAKSTEVLPNDILFTMTGTKGKRDYFYTVLVNDGHTDNKHLFINQRVGIFRQRSNKIKMSFANYILKEKRILDNVFLSETGTANQGNLGIENISRTKLYLPALEEQEEIVVYLDKKCAQIDRLIAIKQAKIEKLEQYKRSLIYEYVTGKKEVI